MATCIANIDGNDHDCYTSRTPRSYTEYVYIQDELYSWLPAKILSMKGTQAQVQVIKSSNWTTNTVLAAPKTPLRGSRLKFNREEGQIYDISVQKDIRIIDLSAYPGAVLPLQNIDTVIKPDDGQDEEKIKLNVKPDMSDLAHLHEAAVLFNIKELYCRPADKSVEAHRRCVPYTRVGDIIIALNPFAWMEELYSEKTQTFYADALVWSVPRKLQMGMVSLLFSYIDCRNVCLSN